MNSLIVESVFLQILFMHPRNSSGPKTLPCGTSEVTVTSLDSCPPTLTFYVWPTRNSLTQMPTLESMYEAARFVNGHSWGTKLKALGKSIINASILTPSSEEFTMSWHTMITWLSHEYPGLNPCCPSYNQSFLFQTCLKYPAITCSSCLQTTEVKSPQSYVYVCNADCSVCVVTKMCPSFWSSFIKLLMAHLLIVMTLIGVFLLCVLYHLPKETHLCCGSITTIYPTWYHHYHEQYEHSNKLLSYCAPIGPLYMLCTMEFPAAVHMKDQYIVWQYYTIYTDDWPVRCKILNYSFLKYCCMSSTVVCTFWV